MKDKNKDEFIAKKMKVLMGENYDKGQAYAISLSMFEKENKQEGGKINGYDNIQKPIKNIMKVGTNEVKEGSLAPGNYTRVQYSDNSFDYIKPENEDMLRRMPNYLQYMERVRREQALLKNPTQPMAQTGDVKTPYYQMAGMYLDPNIFNTNFTLPNTQLPQQDFSVENQERLRNYYTPAQPMVQEPSQNVPAPTYYDTNPPFFSLDRQTPAAEEVKNEPTQTEANKRYNIINPYGGIDLESSLSYTGQQFGKGNTGMGVAGAGLSFLKGAREFMGGYASGKESDRVRDEYFNNTFEYNPNYKNLQQGGKKVTNAQMLTGEFIADEGQGNTIMESDEFVKRAETGEVQKVVGEPHIRNGKIAEGVEANLDNGDKVLSTYVKIPPKDVKELKERYQISLKKNATFADAQKAFDKKIGIQKTTDELASYIEKLGENESVKDETAKRLNELALTKEIQEYKTKLDTLKEPQSMVFEDLFSRQERLPKKGNGSQLFDKNGKEVTEVAKDTKQEGGKKENILALASKYGIPPERAMELVNYSQEGGEQQDQMQQLFQAVAQMLQEGQTPEQIAQQLVQNGVPQEQVGAIIEQVTQQLQSQAPEQQMAQEGGYSFSTKYTPKVAGYDVMGNAVIDQDSLSGVESTQKYTGQGYGEKMADVNKFINTHSWYFDTEEKKNNFKEAVKKEGQQPEIIDFQNKYNEELRKRAKSVGISKDEENKIINELGFSGRGVQKYDGLFGAFTSTRPLVDFKKTDGEVKVDVKPVVGLEEKNIVIPEETTENVLPWLPQNLRLAPSSLDPMKKAQVSLPRMEAIKGTAEPMLAEAERNRQTDVARVQASGLTSQQQEAMLAQGLSTSQMSSNDAIAKVEQANRQGQFAADQFNLNQDSKEQITNAQFRQDYQNKAMQSLANQERDWNNYYTNLNLDNANKFKYIEEMNWLNAKNSNFQNVPGRGIQFIGGNTTDLSLPNITQEDLDKMTPEEFLNYKRMVGAKKKYGQI